MGVSMYQGHVIGSAITGGGGSSQQEAAPAPAEFQPVQQQQQQPYNPCQRELQQFLDCAQGQSDIALCTGFNEALRQCKLQYGELAMSWPILQNIHGMRSPR